MSAERVLLTGASGFIAAHVLDAFLEKGHFVRSTVRSQEKADYILAAHQNYKHLLEVAIVPDITIDGAFDEALKDNSLDGVIHTASPLNANFSHPREVLDPAIRGTEVLLNSIVKLAPKVRRVVITSSFSAIINPKKGSWPGHEYSENDWNPITMEEALNGSIIDTYRGSKKFAESAAWDLVSKNKPNFDLVTICPPMVYGPIINDQKLSGLNTSTKFIWRYVKGDVKEIEPTFNPLWIDVRDVAVAHLKAFEVSGAGGGRFFVVSDERCGNQDIADILRKHFPELKDKIPEGTPGQGFVPGPEGFYTTNNSRSKDILGLTYRPLENCIVDTVTSLMRLS